jgi:chorismate-pyruvate lyase
MQLHTDDSRAVDPVWDAVEAIEPADPRLTLFQKILLTTDGTVTELLSLYCGQAIHARKLWQSTQPAPDRAARDIGIAAPLLLRTVLLEDATGVPLLHATSRLALAQMPQAIRRDLQETELPIGLLWRRERLEMYREILGCQRGTAPEIARLLAVPPATLLLNRRYRLHHLGQPMGMIEETFATPILR